MVLDPTEKRLTYANAGHAIPYRLQFSGADCTLGALPGSGPLLGDSDGTVYKDSRSFLSGDDAFVLFTNGLLKVRDAAKVEYGDRSLQRLLKKQAVNSPEAIRDALVKEVRAYGGKLRLKDDQAAVVISSRFVV
jgi:serine phosphatase RsbU (regulator of sigma subunit)